MNLLYKYRGLILSFMALLLFIMQPENNLIPVSCVFLLVAGVFLRVESRRVIGEHSRGIEKTAPILVTWGIYSKIRHPLYLSNFCVSMAFVLFHLGWCGYTFVFASLLALFMWLLAFGEDKFLEDRFGRLFLDWASVTGAFFPRKKSNVSLNFQTELSKSERSLFSAFAADKWTWIWLLFYSLLLIFRRHLVLF